MLFADHELISLLMDRCEIFIVSINQVESPQLVKTWHWFYQTRLRLSP